MIDMQLTYDALRIVGFNMDILQAVAQQAAPLFATIGGQIVPESAGDAYARIKRAREQQGLSLDENNLWIAATASALDATLVTRDRDFGSVEGLTTASSCGPSGARPR